MANTPTREQRARWEEIRALGCVVCGGWYPEIHHIETGGGGRKNHDRVIPLCANHHTGPAGIHQRRKGWQEIYGTEAELLEKTNQLLQRSNAA